MTNKTPKDLRNAFGNFATGITVITSIDTKGRPQGITVNSFSTVSLDPPLISWCIGRKATLFSLFQQAEHFAVNILSIDQKSISELFASSSVDKFPKQSWSSGI